MLDKSNVHNSSYCIGATKLSNKHNKYKIRMFPAVGNKFSEASKWSLITSIHPDLLYASLRVVGQNKL